MESGKSSSFVTEPSMVPKRHVRRPESCALVQRQGAGVSSGCDHGRLPNVFLLKEVCRLAQEVATDPLPSPLFIDRKQAYTRRSGGPFDSPGRAQGRRLLVDVQRDIANRSAFTFGND